VLLVLGVFGAAYRLEGQTPKGAMDSLWEDAVPIANTKRISAGEVWVITSYLRSMRIPPLGKPGHQRHIYSTVPIGGIQFVGCVSCSDHATVLYYGSWKALVRCGSDSLS